MARFFDGAYDTQVNCFVITLTNLAVCGGPDQPKAGSLRS
jgi:hypothetical protein